MIIIHCFENLVNFMEIHVSRDNESIGKFDEKSIREGLSYGNLLPSDMFFMKELRMEIARI